MTGFSQEVLVGLSENVQIINQPPRKSVNAADTFVELPFFEDFSGGEILPNEDLWYDQEAFINQDYAVYPTTIGVATLDAIDSDGYLHDDASIYQFESDHLTSNYIRLDSVFSPTPKALQVSDSIYFSFYYQPQGFGNDPQPVDSLVLEFLAISENDTIVVEGETTAENDTTIYEGWNRMWSSAGTSLEDFYTAEGVYFKQVIIPVIDSTKFFNKNFQFRFMNYASVADNSLLSWQSNVDHWNIDYIELDQQRTYDDTVHNDVAFVTKAQSFLKRYSAMPHWQYRSNFVDETKISIENTMVNLDDEAHNTRYEYFLYNPSGNLVDSYDGEYISYLPYDVNGFVNSTGHSNPSVVTPYPFTTDSITFTTVHVLTSDASLEHQENDTIRATQTFHNYYAYDDGTAEAGYGITPAGGMLAYSFQLNDPDTLTAIDIFFNRTLNDGNEVYFYITVWDDNNGIPGDILYQSESSVQVEYAEELNGFTTYEIDPVILSKQNATFYIGWEQVTDEILNIGFDYAVNNNDKIMYNTSGEWYTSSYEGSLMLRPIFDEVEQGDDSETTVKSTEMSIFPNPANSSDVLKITLPDNIEASDDLQMNVYNVSGQVLYQGSYQSELNISNFRRGVYVVLIQDPTHQITFSDKFVITH